MSDYRIEAATREEWAQRAILAEARLAAMEAMMAKLADAVYGIKKSSLCSGSREIARRALADLKAGK